MSRSDQYAVSVSIDGTPLGVFDTFGGGAVDSQETKYRPGAMSTEVSLGGTRTVGNVTVGRLYDLARDHDLVRWLMGRAGRGRATITKQPLDTDRNPFGRPLVYTGKLKTVTPPDHDSNDSNPSVWTMEISTEGDVG